MAAALFVASGVGAEEPVHERWPQYQLRAKRIMVDYRDVEVRWKTLGGRIRDAENLYALCRSQPASYGPKASVGQIEQKRPTLEVARIGLSKAIEALERRRQKLDLQRAELQRARLSPRVKNRRLVEIIDKLETEYIEPFELTLPLWRTLIELSAEHYRIAADAGIACRDGVNSPIKGASTWLQKIEETHSRVNGFLDSLLKSLAGSEESK